MTEQELEKAIHFRTIDAPCCGNCKWFKRLFEDTECENLDNCWNYEEDSDDEECQNKFRFINEHDVCDRFERREDAK